MARPTGNAPNARRSTGKWNYFYLRHPEEGNLLHTSLFVDRSSDTIIAWCYPLAQRVTYTYTDVKARRDPAFRTTEVAEMLNRRRLVLELAILSGNIEKPQMTYGLNAERRPFQHLWHETNILEAREFLLTQHYGRPRNDGLIRPKPLPTLRELRAMIKQEVIPHYLNEEGDFVPGWKAPNFD